MRKLATQGRRAKVILAHLYREKTPASANNLNSWSEMVNRSNAGCPASVMRWFQCKSEIKYPSVSLRPCVTEKGRCAPSRLDFLILEKKNPTRINSTVCMVLSAKYRKVIRTNRPIESNHRNSHRDFIEQTFVWRQFWQKSRPLLRGLQTESVVLSEVRPH